MKARWCLASYLLIAILFFLNCSAKLPILSSTTSDRVESTVESMADFCGIEKLGYSDLREENEDFVRRILEDMGIERKVIIRRFTNRALMMGMWENACCLDLGGVIYLFFDEYYFNVLPAAEKEYLVRHECSHALRLHLPIQIAIALIAPKIINWLNRTVLQEKLNKEYTFICEQSKLAMLPIAIAGGVLRVTLKSLCLGLLQLNISRICEFDADITAARFMKTTDGAIDHMKRRTKISDQPSRFKLIRIIDNLIEILVEPLQTHPSWPQRMNAVRIFEQNKNASLLEVLVRHYYGMARSGMRSVSRLFSYR